jgi:DNA repair protein RadC
VKLAVKIKKASGKSGGFLLASSVCFCYNKKNTEKGASFVAQKQDFIAVFDSGVGGISVLRQLHKLMPNERYLYYGDSANAPYGTKTPEQVRALALAVAEKLVNRGIKALVVACNTATAMAIKQLREKYPDLIVVGIEPALKVGADRYPGGRIGVMATPVTLEGEKFHRLLDRFGSLAGVFDAAPKALLAVEGVNESTVALLRLLRELMDYSPRPIVRPDTPEALERYVRALFRPDQRHVCLLALDGEGQVTAVERLEGPGSTCPRLDVKAVVIAAARLSPEAVALAVPRLGRPELPSEEDLEDALRCERVLSALDVCLLDVLLCSDAEVLSLRRMRLLH